MPKFNKMKGKHMRSFPPEQETVFRYIFSMTDDHGCWKDERITFKYVAKQFAKLYWYADTRRLFTPNRIEYAYKQVKTAKSAHMAAMTEIMNRATAEINAKIDALLPPPPTPTPERIDLGPVEFEDLVILDHDDDNAGG